jgi:phage nucleotide-binding protein
MEFQKTSETQNKHVKILVYGKAGVGKTRLISTAPKPFIIDTDQGTLSLSDKDIPMKKIETMEDFDTLLNLIKTSPNFDKIETIVLDSLSALALIVYNEAGKANKNNMAKYGAYQDRLTQAILDLRNVKKHIYITSGVQVNTVDNVDTYTIDVKGKALLYAIPSWFDEFFYVEKISKKCNIRTTGCSLFESRDKSGKLADNEEPDLTNIINKITMKGVSK